MHLLELGNSWDNDACIYQQEHSFKLLKEIIHCTNIINNT